ncbi:MAG: CYTH domain-containing protein [Clostridiaceae bacterium]|nr:CYTH domain-containing protein [Clostridiaceae bacterium]
MESELKFILKDDIDFMEIMNEPIILDHLLLTGNMSYAMRSSYFDTENQLLRQRKGFLRIRRSNERFYLTLKLPNHNNNMYDDAGIFERQEWEFELNDEEQYWDMKTGINTTWFLNRMLIGAEYRESSDPDLIQILRVIEGRPLYEVCLADYTRTSYAYSYRSSRFELCFDEGYLGTAEYVKQFSEIELELLTGNREDLFYLKHDFLTQLPVISATKSKYDQAIEIADLYSR